MQFASHHNRRNNELTLLPDHLALEWSCIDARISFFSGVAVVNKPGKCNELFSKLSSKQANKNNCSTCEPKDPAVSSSETDGDEDSCGSIESLPVRHPSSIESSSLHWFLQDLLGDMALRCTIVDDRWVVMRKTQPVLGDRTEALPVEALIEDLPPLLTFSQEHAAFI
jgi:hypothetical protein